MKCVIYSSLCAFYVSQSELRHLQRMVSVCVCVCMCVRARDLGWIALCIFCLPKCIVPSTVRSQCVCARVCEPHGFEYGCIEFEDGSSTGSSLGAIFGENPKKKKAIAIYQN